MQQGQQDPQAVHATYEQQVAATDAQMLGELWERLTAVAQGATAVQVAREGRTLILTEPSSGRTLQFVMDEVLDLPESERPGPFAMGNARVSITAWDGTRRAWLLRNVAAGALEQRWVTLPGDVPVNDDVITRLVGGLTRGEMPASPAETVHVNATASDAGTLATGEHWAIVNLYSGERREPGEVFGSGDEAGEALKELVRSGQAREGDWEVRPTSVAS